MAPELLKLLSSIGAFIAIGVGVVALAVEMAERQDRRIYGAHTVRTVTRREPPCRCAVCTRVRTRTGVWPR